jgi:integral membrane sensor domain MASE1
MFFPKLQNDVNKTYIHIYIQYIHTYIHTHTYVHSYTFVHTYVHTYTHIIQTYIHTWRRHTRRSIVLLFELHTVWPWVWNNISLSQTCTWRHWQLTHSNLDCCTLSIVVVSATLGLRYRKVRASNFGTEALCTVYDLRSFPQSPQISTGIIHQVTPRQYPFEFVSH